MSLAGIALLVVLVGGLLAVLVAILSTRFASTRPAVSRTPSHPSGPVGEATSGKRPIIFDESLERIEDDRSEEELFDEALLVITEIGTVSLLAIQRRVRIDFDAATRLVERMEERGLVGKAEGARPRKVLPAAFDAARTIEAGPDSEQS